MTAAFYQNETKFYVAVDCIILGFDQKELNVLLYKRKFEPMMGQWSLMGGFIKAGESIEEAASRATTLPVVGESLWKYYGKLQMTANNY